MIRAILTSGSMRSLRHKPDRSCATKPGHISCHRQAAGERCGLAHVLLSAARETTDKGRGCAMIQELKTILIVVSATLAALFVHHALEQAQAAAATISVP